MSHTLYLTEARLYAYGAKYGDESPRSFMTEPIVSCTCTLTIVHSNCENVSNSSTCHSKFHKIDCRSCLLLIWFCSVPVPRTIHFWRHECVWSDHIYHTPVKYTHSSFYDLFCRGFGIGVITIAIRITYLPRNHPNASEKTLGDMGEYVTWKRQKWRG